jgi:hypothetical protein
MPRTAEAMEEFVDEFERYIDFVDETREAIHATLVNLRETTFVGELGSKFEDLVRADAEERLTPLHEEFSLDLIQLRADIEYLRAFEAGEVNIG